MGPDRPPPELVRGTAEKTIEVECLLPEKVERLAWSGHIGVRLVPLVLERILPDASTRSGGPASWIHTKALYKLSDESMSVLQGCTVDMCTTSWVPRGLSEQLIDPDAATHVPEVNPFMEDFSSDADDDKRSLDCDCDGAPHVHPTL